MGKQSELQRPKLIMKHAHTHAHTQTYISTEPLRMAVESVLYFKGVYTVTKLSVDSNQKGKKSFTGNVNRNFYRRQLILF